MASVLASPFRLSTSCAFASSADKLDPGRSGDGSVCAARHCPNDPGGAPVDQTIAALRPLLSAGDTIIDGGNSDFRDTMIRTTTLEKAGLSYLGIGVSGGAEGARRGPSMMVGGRYKL